MFSPNLEYQSAYSFFYFLLTTSTTKHQSQPTIITKAHPTAT